MDHAVTSNSTMVFQVSFISFSFILISSLLWGLLFYTERNLNNCDVISEAVEQKGKGAVIEFLGKNLRYMPSIDHIQLWHLGFKPEGNLFSCNVSASCTDNPTGHETDLWFISYCRRFLLQNRQAMLPCKSSQNDVIARKGVQNVKRNLSRWNTRKTCFMIHWPTVMN